MLGQHCISLPSHEVVLTIVVALLLPAIKALVSLRNYVKFYYGAIKSEIIKNDSSRGGFSKGFIRTTVSIKGSEFLRIMQKDACAIATVPKQKQVCQKHLPEQK